MTRVDLKAERINRGLSLDALSEETGVPKATLARAERREGVPTARVQHAIATYFNKQPTEIWPLDDEPAEVAA
jgi:lambda repressor-like predicted transcriptional regulator